MSLYEILKAAKIGAASDMLTRLRSQIAPFAKGGSSTTEKELEDTPPLSFYANGENLVAWAIYGNSTQSTAPSKENPSYLSGCGDLVENGEHSGEYAISITCGGRTSFIYSSEPLLKIEDAVNSISNSKETRYIEKKVFTGQEEWTRNSGNSVFYTSIQNGKDLAGSVTSICSHYEAQENVTAYSNMVDKKCCIKSGSAIWIKDTDISSAAAFKTFLQEQYEAGTPVTIWYIMSSATETSIQTPDIPTIDGFNTLSVNTAVQPSSIYIKYKG